jgi:hypothetical protein
VPDPHPLQGLGPKFNRTVPVLLTGVGQLFDLLMLHPSRPTVPEV